MCKLAYQVVFELCLFRAAGRVLFQIANHQMEISNLIPHIESLIFASEKPLTSVDLTDLVNNAFGFMEDKIGLDKVEAAMEGIVEKYQSEFYPFEVRQSGGGWQFLTKKEYHKTVAQLNGEKFLKRLSSAALETLAIIAYKQPVTKAEIEAIRGVSSDYAVQKLLEKDLIIITGRNEASPGHPLVYATSKNFMDYFGINSADDLPKLREIFDESMISPTVLGGETAYTTAAEETSIEEEEIYGEDDAEEIVASTFVVSESGELLVEPISAEEISEAEDFFSDDESPEAEEDDAEREDEDNKEEK